VNDRSFESLSRELGSNVSRRTSLMMLGAAWPLAAVFSPGGSAQTMRVREWSRGSA
jgi:hypothetical protein